MLRQKLESFRKSTKQSVVLTLIKADFLFFSGDILEAVSDENFKRNQLPEPFDVPDHIGNFREAAMGTMAAYGMIGIFRLIIPALDHDRELFKKRARTTAVAAFLVSSAVQVIGEKYGLTNNLLAANTPDMVDAAYGVGWSAVVAGASYSQLMTLEQNMYERREQADITANDEL